MVHLDRMVDHQVGGHHGVDQVRVALHPRHGVPHGGEVHHAGHAGEVLQHHPRRHEGDLGLAAAVPVASAELPDVLLGHDPAAGETERVFQQDAEGEGEPVEVAQSLAGELGRGGRRRRWPPSPRVPRVPKGLVVVRASAFRNGCLGEI